MSYGLYVSAEGATAQTKRMEIIANNLANVDTVGFKRQLAIIQARFAESIRQGTAMPGSGSLGDLGGGVHLREIKTDFSTAPLKRTDLPSDVAIPGEGFFAVRKGQEVLLTRAGNFRVTSAGELVTQQGYAVLGEGNGSIAIQADGTPWHISATGAVVQADNSQNLALVRPASLNDLVPVGENLFRAQGQVLPLPADKRNVSSGYTEASGVEPTLEMTTLIETSRLLEANVNLMKAQDQMMNNLTSRLLKA